MKESPGKRVAYPDTLVGTDSHTTMINGLGVLGWGVGGIEAEAAMLGQPVSMLIPQVVGVKLTGRLREGATATDLVLTITEMLRKHGVVGKFVEYFGPGLQDLPLADRATIGNMSPEYGATCGIFPVDKETLDYLRLTGRSDEQIALVEAYCREQGLFHDENTPEAEYSELLALDLATVEPSLAGPKRPQDRVALSDAEGVVSRRRCLLIKAAKAGATPAAINGNGNLHHGSVVIAAITSCTNTSNPSVMLAAGLLAKKAVERGLRSSGVGEDVAGAGIESGPRLSREAGLIAVSGKAEVPYCRLRLHHLHRELRAAARGSFARKSTRKISLWRRCFRGIATSKAASILMFARII